MTGRAVLVVSEADTAVAMETGTVPVLASPRLVALCERASVAAVADRLPPGTTTVGARVQFDHLAPIRVGTEVQAEATLERVEGRRLMFTVAVSWRSAERTGLIAAGRLTRVVVDRRAFLAKAGCGGADHPAPTPRAGGR